MALTMGTIAMDISFTDAQSLPGMILGWLSRIHLRLRVRGALWLKQRCARSSLTSVTIDSTLGKGTTVTCVFPTVQKAERAAT
jgi:hypothetical protein